jgi:diketogulonate reductase-like aldo/keto reductase
MSDHKLKLNTGRMLPSVGLGTWKIDRAHVAGTVVEAIRCGYRHLDCASDYGNEAEVETEAVREMALRHRRTPAQIVLRWGVQRGTAVVPKTARLDRLKENLALFDFRLSDSEMQTLRGMNRNRRFNDPGDFCEAAFGRFFPIYE